MSLHSYFQVSPEMFDRVQVRALAGPLNDIERFVPKPLMHCLGCELRVIVLLEGENVSIDQFDTFGQTPDRLDTTYCVVM